MAKKKKTDINDILYMNALNNRHVPLLTLDANWHGLFPDFRKTKEIRDAEKKLNKLIKRQGQNNADIKEYEKAKKILMNNVIANMTDGNEQDSPIRAQKQDMNQDLIGKVNDRIIEAYEEQEVLPDQINRANKELLIECMRVCYDELMENTENIEELDKWIKKTREELKMAILQKQDLEMRNTQTYSYMHNLLGAEVVNIFDREHKVWRGNVEEKRLNDDDNTSK